MNIVQATLKELPVSTYRYTGELSEAIRRFMETFTDEPEVIYQWGRYWCIPLPEREEA